MMTANQIRSKPFASSTGVRMGITIRMIATGGRKQPATSRNTLMAAISTQRLRFRSTSHCAAVWVTYSSDIMYENTAAAPMIIRIIVDSRTVSRKIGHRSPIRQAR